MDVKSLTIEDKVAWKRVLRGCGTLAQIRLATLVMAEDLEDLFEHKSAEEWAAEVNEGKHEL